MLQTELRPAQARALRAGRMANERILACERPARPSAPDTSAQERALLARYARTRDTQARETLIRRHWRLVPYVAARFAGHGEALEDLTQVAAIGLILALDRYDPAQGVAFSTYAIPTIVGEIKRHFRDKSWQVKVPRWLQDRCRQARDAHRRLALTLMRAPTAREVAEELGCTEEEALEALEVWHSTAALSLDALLRGGAQGTRADSLGAPDAALQDLIAHADLRRALGCLDAQERAVVERRFFDDQSQSAAARDLGISQMQVSRLQRRALDKLRAILHDARHPDA